MYPTVRMRRNRKSAWIRELVAETSLSPANLVLPIFVIEGHNKREPIKKMPGVYRLSIDLVIEAAKQAAALGIKAIALFPSVDPSLKSDDAEEAYNLDNLMCRTIRSIKNAAIDIGIICDVALDPYTTHGHDGILIEGEVDNDATLEVLCNQALVLAKAGVDIVAPSDMMDGRIGAIRKELDDDGFSAVNILAYAAKYNSCFYGPFRDAVKSHQTGYLDKSSYQMDFRNTREAMREIEYDIAEGADLIMIKPGLPYLDVIHQAVSSFDVNIFAYQVTGEYAMLKFAAEAGALDWDKSLIESLTAFRRAGATGIFTYAALEAAEFLIKGQ